MKTKRNIERLSAQRYYLIYMTLCHLRGLSYYRPHRARLVLFSCRGPSLHPKYTMSTSNSTTAPKASPERAAEIRESLLEIRSRVNSASCSSSIQSDSTRTLVAVSKYKPSADILVCYEDGQRDFGENYVQELVDKAKEVSLLLQWKFDAS